MKHMELVLNLSTSSVLGNFDTSCVEVLNPPCSNLCPNWAQVHPFKIVPKLGTISFSGNFVPTWDEVTTYLSRLAICE